MYINPETYIATTLLTHYFYDGEYWDEESLMEALNISAEEAQDILSKATANR